MRVQRYESEFKKTWDVFIKTSFNGNFLLCRDYMDYHADRFDDHSVMIYSADKLIAVLPANQSGQSWVSHGGLTFGGIVMGAQMSQRSVIECLQTVIDYLKNTGFSEVVYKALPPVYFDKVYQNLEFGLSYLGFQCFRKDASTSVILSERGKVTKGRKSSIKKAMKLGVTVQKSDNLEKFFQIQDENIKKKYGAKSVHNAAEMHLLKESFPENIRLYQASLDNEFVAGAIVYLNRSVMHLQYFAMNEKGEQSSATDLLIDSLLSVCAEEGYKIFDFGISTEKGGMYLNEGLNRYKESFGGVTTLYEFYKLEI